MALSNFFRVNMPYCIDVHGNTITARNREYQPLNAQSIYYEPSSTALANFMQFVVHLPKSYVIPLEGGGYRVFLYDDRTNPSDPGNEHHWVAYAKALQLLANHPVKQ